MNTYHILGLMSGTSLDGLDLAYCSFTKQDTRWKYQIIKTESLSYDSTLQQNLKEAIDYPAIQLLQLHSSYGIWLGEKAKSFIEKHKLAVDYIASHGHTTHHRPELGFTLQIGSGQHIANTTNLPVVCDFRSNDVALGGQGAPLVPIGDKLLFESFDFCLNLGGISNISFDQQGERIAYDIGLANMILNAVTRAIGLEYDNGGALAQKGSINSNMLAALNALEYYTLPHPKSVGYEWYAKKVAPIVASTKDTTENLLHTAVHHICEKIADQVALYSTKNNQSILVTGGGALNSFLIATLQEKLGAKAKVVLPEKQLIDFKEAMVFAFMGALRVANQTNVLQSVTGASRDSSSGVLYLPN